jgi:lysine 2,3-aminomutase
MQALRGWTSGLAVPQFVIDSPGGGGKVPLLPEYLEQINDEEVIFRNYEGKRFTYKQPRPVQPSETDVERAAELNVVPISRKKSTAPKRRRRAAGE